MQFVTNEPKDLLQPNISSLSNRVGLVFVYLSSHFLVGLLIFKNIKDIEFKSIYFPNFGLSILIMPFENV
jgi:hypothetical protein